jgi:hypothetical protein
VIYIYIYIYISTFKCVFLEGGGGIVTKNLKIFALIFSLIFKFSIIIVKTRRNNPTIFANKIYFAVDFWLTEKYTSSSQKISEHCHQKIFTKSERIFLYLYSMLGICEILGIREAQKHTDPTDPDSKQWNIYNSSKIKSLKTLQNSRNQDFSYYFCLMMEGSGAGSVLVTNGSGCGSGRPQNIPQHCLYWSLTSKDSCRPSQWRDRRDSVGWRG